MDYRLEPVTVEDGRQIIDIFNYYVENSFAAYPEEKVPYEFFGLFMSMAGDYPFLAAKDSSGRVLGFGMLRPHSPFLTFSRAAEVTYFISPEGTGQGIGQEMLDRLLDEAGKRGVRSILASISSLNSRSLAFHEKNGFREVGRFIGIGRKKGQDFDVVWMQRMI